MKQRILSLVLAAALVLGLAGCGGTPPATTKPPASTAPSVPTTSPTTQPVIDGAALYDQARQAVDEAANLELSILVKQEVTVGDQSYSLTSSQQVQISGANTGDSSVVRSETLTLGSEDITLDEIYVDGILYTTLSDYCAFSGTQGDYLEQLIPGAVLSTALYAQISATDMSGGTLVTFDTAAGAEHWALPKGATYITSSGSAYITSEGQLQQNTYNLTYQLGASQVTLNVQVTPLVIEAPAIAAPATGYTPVSSVEAVRAYGMALLHLYNSKSVTSTSYETVVSQAAGLVRTDQATVDFYGAGSDFAAKIVQKITAAMEGESETYTMTELYRDGTYTATVEGEQPQTAQLTNEDMLSYCQDYLMENLVDLGYATDLRLENLNGISYVELDFEDAYGEALSKYISGSLFQDENYLDSFASAYQTLGATGYLAMDSVTGFPTATGITYAGSHTIDGVDFALSLQVDQSFYLASQTSYETATGEALPETQPDTAATPLLYHVTGSSGQEMWLFGTIHAGDSRTAYLPQEIYDALNGSDALAVEADIQAFEESLESDPAVAAQIASLYFFTDGTSTAEHLEADVYETALKLLKASGSYNDSIELMKPYLWSQAIENFYLRQGYGLNADRGVDNRLLTYAKEHQIPVLDIESGLDQIAMFTGFSLELQAQLLEESLGYDVLTYCSELAELYEAWCAGDETVLRSLMVSDLSGLTDGELALIEEYNQAMHHDRNAHMLSVAEQYLSSGETVFYAVGLAHLLNDTTGLVDALRDAGYTVELVSYQ